MCLAVPAMIIVIDETIAQLEMAGNRITADISLVPDAAVGDYVMVHAGFAIQKYDQAEALLTLELLREYAEKLEGPTDESID